MSPVTSRQRGSARASARFSRLPRMRLSKIRTSRTPSSRSWSATCEPIRPAPPTTRTVEPRRLFGIARPLATGHGGRAHAGHLRHRATPGATDQQFDAQLQIPPLDAPTGPDVPLPVVARAFEYAVGDGGEGEILAAVRAVPLEPKAVAF